MPLKLDVHVGETVQIGQDAAVRVETKQRRGGRDLVRLAIFALPHVYPIQLIPSGIIPRHLTYGITGQPRPVPSVPA